MATIKYKDENGEWKELTVLKGDSGVAPIINPDTNTWLVWDNEQGVYVDTGVVAGVGTEDFYASTYWVFNEMASGKKVIAKALTDRRYPTNNDESFVDMAQKITDMSYEEGWFAKIGYTDDNNGGIKNAINYSYELAKGWNPDGSTMQMFRGNKLLIFLPWIDTSNVTTMESMFYGCSALSTIPKLDTSNVTTMGSMFYGCSALSTIPKLDTSNVTNMGGMFYGCSALSTIPKLDTSNVTNMGGMFNGCSALSTIPKLDTSNVTTMESMFYGCSALSTIPKLDTSNVTSMGNMFNECSALTTIPLLDMSSVTNMGGMFNACSALRFMKISNIGKSTLTTYVFSRATWGTGGEENRQSLIDSLLTYSFDRASNGMSTATIKLSANTKALLTEEEIAQITNKGFTIS